MPHRLIISWSTSSAPDIQDETLVQGLVAHPGVKQARVFHAADGLSDVMVTLDFADPEGIERYLDSFNGTGAGSELPVARIPGMRVWSASPKSVPARRPVGGALF